MPRTLLFVLSLTFAAAGQSQTADTYLPWEGGSAYCRQWTFGPPSDQDYFPIGVWLQSPPNAWLFQSIGVNLFIGLWDGCVEKDPSDGAILPVLRKFGMPVICDQETGLAGPDAAAHRTDPIIRGWNHSDEPDNAQWNSAPQAYDPCIDPAVIVNRYDQYRAADPNRPVFLGLGQGVGFDADSPYVGRGAVCNEGAGRGLADYPKYIQGADIVANDSYPRNNHVPLWWVGRSVDRMREWAGYRKAVWTWIETTNIDPASGNGTPSAADVRSEVWMTLIHGGLGFGYFVHQFSPVFEEDSIFFPEHADIKNAVAAVNAQVTALARVLNTPSVGNGVTVISSNPDVPVDLMLKRYGGSTFLFAMGARDGGAATATFHLRDFPGYAVATVLGENRRIEIRGGEFEDRFNEYEAHLYQILFAPEAQARLGDLNGDGRVNSADLLIVAAALGKKAGEAGYDPRADFIRDGLVDWTDLAAVNELMFINSLW